MMNFIRLSDKEFSKFSENDLSGHSLYNSLAFLNLWKSIGGTPVFWAVEEDSNILAMLCGVEFGNSLIKRFQSMPDGCYCQPLIRSSNKNQLEIYEFILNRLQKEKYSKIFIYDFNKTFKPNSNYDIQTCTTNIIDISSNDWEPPDKKIQSEIRKAEREGVIVQRFDANKQMDAFIRLMIATEERHNRKPKYSRSFYEQLAQMAETDSRIEWAWVEYEGKGAASHIYFIDNEQALNWQVFFDKDYSFLKPNQLITYQTAKKLSSSGVRYFNLGANPAGSENLESYKKKWGGENYEYPCYVYKSFLGKIK